MTELRIELYKSDYLRDFVRLNSEWIQTFFHLESSDLDAFSDPEKYILKQGGQIFFAVNELGRPVGCCALINHPDEKCFELAKMAVSPNHQGRGVGRLLGEAVLAYARGQGIERIFLEGNMRLEASLALYRKLGFKKAAMRENTHQRCDIIMELDL